MREQGARERKDETRWVDRSGNKLRCLLVCCYYMWLSDRYTDTAAVRCSYLA